MRAQTERSGPVRSCCACRRRLPKRQLLRVARGTAGLELDVRMRASGRGAYVCSAECLETALRKGAFSRALGIDPSPDAAGALLREGVEYLSKLNEGADG